MNAITTQRLFIQRTILLLIAAAILFFSHSVMAQNATANIATGRAKLALQTPGNLSQADAAFTQALSSDANNLEANLLKAATSLLLEQNSTQFRAQLTGVGISSGNNNNIYQPQYVLPRDAAGNLQPTAGATTNSTLAYINTKTALIDNALANLDKFSSNATGFQITLNATETAMAATRVAYADVVMLRAFLKGAKAFIALANSYNFNAEYAALLNLDKTGELTPQKVLEILPDLLKFANSAQRATAKTLLISANTDYQAAHAIIKNRSVTVNGTPYLFEYGDPVEADTYATQISGLVASLSSGGNFNLNTVKGAVAQPLGITINPNAFLTATQPLRSFITSNSSGFEFGYPTRTSWPDPTFGGFLNTNSAALLDSLEDGFLKDARFERRLQLLSQRPVRTGTVRAWGSNASGQTTVPAGLTNVVQVATGGNHTLALKADGSVVACGNNAQGQASLPAVVTTLAGSGFEGSIDGIASGAAFNRPTGVAVDGSGNIYVADNFNNKIRKITAEGVVTTLAGSGAPGASDGTGSGATFNRPAGIAVDGSGNVYVADGNNKIRKITSAGVVTTLAGSGAPGASDGTGSGASFSNPVGVAVDGNGNVYVGDYGNHKIRKITPAGVVTTLAGSGAPGASDGTGSGASFSNPSGVAVDATGNLYVADTSNNKIRKITASGNVTTLAGSGSYGSTDGQGTAARFYYPRGVAVDGNGNVYVGDEVSTIIRKITPTGVVTTLAGNPGWYGPYDGFGNASSFNRPFGVAVDGNGNVYVADTDNAKIRKISQGSLSGVNQISAGANHSIALKSDGTFIGWGDMTYGQAGLPYWFDWYGFRKYIQVSAGGNHSLALTSDGFVDAWGDNSSGQAPDPSPDFPFFRNLNRVVQVSAGGSHSLALTSYGSVVAWGNNTSNQTSVPTAYTQASFGRFLGLAVYGTGNNSITYVADADSNKIRKITANGIVSTFAGSGSYGSTDGNGTAATFNNPKGAAVDASGNVYVADSNLIRKITPTGMVSTLAGSANNWSSADGTGSSASFSWNAGGIAVASDGTIYVTDTGNNKIRKITANGIVTTLAGSGARGAVDGSSYAASFNVPSSLAVYGSGNNTIVYVADYQNNKIRKITADGTVTTFAGNGTAGFADGNGTAARFNNPEGIAVDGSGNVYVADSCNNRIRKITANGTVTTLAGSGINAVTDGTGSLASFYYPDEIAVDSSGNLYVADRYKIRKVTSAGVVTTIAGAETYGSTDGAALMAPANRMTQIAAGGAHSVALTANGTVIAWGSNAAGQTSVPIGLNNVVQIAAGQNHSLARKADGTIVTWGNTASGLGTVPAGMTNPGQVAGGGSHSAVLFTPNPPVVASATISARVGAPLSYTVNATNAPGAFVATGLPAWLTLDSTSGLISGTPSVIGNATVSILASNGGGNGTGVLTINVAKGNQTISGLAASDIRTIGGNFTINATTNAGLPVLYASSNNAVATISNGTVTLKAVGNITITASQSGNANWNAAPNFIQSLSVVTLSPTDAIALGRGQLKLQSPAGLLQADSFINQALSRDSNNLEANLLKAATSLLLEQSSPDFLNQIKDIGVKINNPNLYDFEYDLPIGPDGKFQPTAGVTTDRTLAYINSKTALIDSALNNLGKFSNNSTGFRITLNATETSLADTRVDYGDVMMLRAFLKGAKAIIALANSYNLSAEYAALFNLDKAGELTPQKVLEILPNLFRFSTSNQRAAARTLIISANADYQAAHAFIKTSRLPANGIPYLFEYGDTAQADTYATQINGFVTSLNAGTTYTLNLLPGRNYTGGNLTVNPSLFFTSTTAPRSFVTSNSSGFEFGYPTRTSWPDTTFGGVLTAGSAPILDALENTFNDLRYEQRLQRLRLRPARTGTIKAWGSNASGQIAIPTGLTNVVQVAAGANHTLALKADGTILGWGDNNFGQVTVPSTVVSTLAGGGYNYWGSGGDGIGTSASFASPKGIATDSFGNIYVADAMNNKIRKITPTGVVTTLAGGGMNMGPNMGQDGTGSAASFSNPQGIAVDRFGTVYVADTMNNKIRKITPAGVVTTLAGGSMNGGGMGGQDGTGSAASFSSPQGIAADRFGTVYVADTMNNKIRKITPMGVVTTLAGGGMNMGPNMGQDGTGSAASFSNPQGIAVDGNGTVYVADTMNNKIRKITPAGVVTTLAGGGSEMGGTIGQDGTGTAATFSRPAGISVDGSGNLYVCDRDSNKIRKITPTGVVTTIAGGSMNGGGMGQDGAGTTASFSGPEGVAVDGAGNIYVADTMNSKIRKITSLNTINQIAAGGEHSLALLADGTVIGWGKNDYRQAVRESWYGTLNNAVQIAAGDRHSIALKDDGTVVAWGDNSQGQAPNGWEQSISSLNKIIQVAAGGNHSLALKSDGTLVVWGTNVSGQTSIPVGYALASFKNPQGVAVDSSGNVYVADPSNNKIRKITSTGVVTTLAGSGEYGSVDGTGTAASFSGPAGVAVDSSGNVYVADEGNHRIRKITPVGVVTTLAGGGGNSWGGFADGTGTAASFSSPAGVAVDGNGNVYVADSMNHRIRKITPAGVVTTLAGGGGNWWGGFADGQGADASFLYPLSVAVDGSGNVYVADNSNLRIRKITSGGLVTTLAGTGSEGSSDGQGSLASFKFPRGVAVDGSGNVYVADYENHRIRKISSSGMVTTLAGGSGIGWNGSGFTEGQGSLASFNYPRGVAVDLSGNVYVADQSNNRIRKITSGGAVTTLAGSRMYGSTDGVSSSAALSSNRITQIAAGGAHSLALTSNGTVLAWGSNANGQTSVPTGLRNVVQIAAGQNHSLALTANGSIVAWGNNSAGQTAIPTSGIANSFQVAAGGAHALVLMASAPLGAPVITGQPKSQLVYAGGNISFNVSAIGANLTYQWFRNGMAITGNNSALLPVVASDTTQGIYTVRVTNSLGNATSEPAVLTLRAAAEWTKQPAPPKDPVEIGDSVTFGVDNITGPGAISYQWLKNGQAIAGKTGTTLQISPVTLSDGGVYSLAVKTSAGTITTDPEILVVRDRGILVYSINATGNSTTAVSKQAASFGGYLVRERSSTDKFHFFWMNITPKTYSYEVRTDISEKSTGPFDGSTSVLRAYHEDQGDEEMIWLSGTDVLTTLNTSLKTLAPATLRGQINSALDDSGMAIEMLNVTLTLDAPQTLKARTSDSNAETTKTRLTNEIKAQGYK